MRQLLPNCDQVFDVLTRGPFPTGAASDDAVEHHLRACHECRQLAEALQPAVELLHEAIAPDEAADLPEYQGLLMAVDRAVATAPREMLPQSIRPTPLRVRRLPRPPARRASPLDLSALTNIVRVAAAVLLFTAVAAMLWGLMSTVTFSRDRGDLMAGLLAPRGPTTVDRLDDRGLMTLASLDLPAQCFPREALIAAGEEGGHSAEAPAVQNSRLHCCTQCHNASRPSGPHTRTFAAMQRSCVACHSL